MAIGARYKVPFRRRRAGKTNYHYRLRLLRSGMTRAVVRKTNSKLIIQFVDYSPQGDLVRVHATSAELKKFGWTSSLTNCSAAYLTGVMAGKRAISKNIDSAVLDIGLSTPVKGSNIFSLLKGMVDAGVLIPHSDEVLPDEERVSGAMNNNDNVKKEFETVKKNIEEKG